MSKHEKLAAATRMQSVLHGSSDLSRQQREKSVGMAQDRSRRMLVDAMKERMRQDGFSEESFRELTPDIAEYVLTELVEGDRVINDGETHGFYRRLLDDHREAMAVIEEEMAG